MSDKLKNNPVAAVLHDSLRVALQNDYAVNPSLADKVAAIKARPGRIPAKHSGVIPDACGHEEQIKDLRAEIRRLTRALHDVRAAVRSALEVK